MLVSSLCASRPRDATRRTRAMELVLRSSVAARSSNSVAAAAPSQQHYNLHSTLFELLPVAPRGGARRHLEEGRELLLPRSISSVAAASAPSRQQQQDSQCPATMSGRLRFS